MHISRFQTITFLSNNVIYDYLAYRLSKEKISENLGFIKLIKNYSFRELKSFLFANKSNM